MSSSLDTIRYHSGIAGEEVAEMVDSLEREVSSLREQVEKLTEAYDQCGRTVQEYGRTIDQTESRLCEVAAHCANVEQQLLALAEQNAKMREALTLNFPVSERARDIEDCSYGRNFSETRRDLAHKRFNSLKEALSLPDLATSILNKEEGEIK